MSTVSRSLIRSVSTSLPRASVRAVRLTPALRSIHTPVVSNATFVFRSQLKQAGVVGIRAKSTKPWGPPIVKYDELKPITEQPTEDILLVDVREPDETALGSIPSAVGLPLSQLKEHLDPKFSEGEFMKQHGFSRPLPNQKIIFFCRSGKRSATACQAASELGYSNIRNYEGSWLDWQEKEKESKKATKGAKWDDEDD